MMITKKSTAEKIAAYLHHEITLSQLVDWAENAVMDGQFPALESGTLTAVVSRLGVADVKSFGLTWDECESLLHQLGYSSHVEVTAA